MRRERARAREKIESESERGREDTQQVVFEISKKASHVQEKQTQVHFE
jgi:hypothetical protein